MKYWNGTGVEHYCLGSSWKVNWVSEKQGFQVSGYIAIAAVIYALLASFYVAYTKYVDASIYTPFISDIVAGPTDLQVEDLQFSVNTTTNRFINVTVDIKNHDTLHSHSGVFYIVFYNTQNSEIAHGTLTTGRVSPGVRIGSSNLALTWIGTYTLNDFNYGKITLTQTE